jgi:hypothetical protein
LKTIIVSAVNITEAGTLTILNDVLSTLSSICTQERYKVIALVYDKKRCYYNNIKYIDIKSSKRNWLNRLYYEFFVFRKISKFFKPYMWLSLHDITPNVIANKRIVYCHNATPFYKFRVKDIRFDLKFVLFVLFYKYLYKINIRKNDAIIVQQDWTRESFSEMYSYPKEKIIVSYPIDNYVRKPHTSHVDVVDNSINFFFPAIARVFKNFEVICKAVEILEKEGVCNYSVIFTIDGTENKYSKWIYSKYNHLKTISFIGRLDKETVNKYYENCSCLLFPSRLESWGLPISEFSKYDRPMIISDLKYAHETASNSRFVAYFNPNDPIELASLMKKVIYNDTSSFINVGMKKINKPFFKTWNDLFTYLLNYV